MICEGCNIEKNCCIHDCGHEFCSEECQRKIMWRPDMSDSTFEYEKTIDELDFGRSSLYLETCDQAYEMYSNYKVLVVEVKPFYHKQLCGFFNIKDAREAWERLKKKHAKKSWADMRER